MAEQSTDQALPDFNSIDFSDPETREWAKKHVDMSDPETAKFFQEFDKPKPLSVHNPKVTDLVSGAATGAPEYRGSFQRLADSFNEAGQHGFPGLVARKWYDWTNAGKEQLKQQFPGQSDDWYEEKADKIISTAQQGLRQEMADKQAQDPTWRPDESFWQNVGAIDRWGPYLAGQVLGSAGPESFISPGGSAVARIGSQAALGGASDALYQAADIKDEVEKEYKLEQTLGAAAAGGALQAGFEGLAKVPVPDFVKNLFRERGVDTTPRPDASIGSGRTPMSGMSLTPEQQAEYADLLNTGSYDDIMRYFDDKNGLKPKPSEVAEWVRQRELKQTPEVGGQDVTYTQQGQPIAPTDPEGELPFNRGIPTQEAEQPNLPLGNRRQPKAQEVQQPEVIPSPELIQAARESTQSHVANVTKGWKNAPEFQVHDSFDELPDVDSDALGVVGPDGKVLLNMKGIAQDAQARGVSPEDLTSAVVYHEGLGHHGLTQQFGNDLDTLLDNMYKGSPKFRRDTDRWMAENPEAYAEDVNPRARAAEEVLAEMSEAGKIPTTLFDRIKNEIKKYGRKAGLDLKYSNREVKSILGMAHDATISGKRGDVRGNGYRYAKTVWHGTPAEQPFDKFDHSKMGSGEGAQVYGWGTYLTDVRNMADVFYRQRLARQEAEFQGQKYDLGQAGDDDFHLRSDVKYKILDDNPVLDKLYHEGGSSPRRKIGQVIDQYLAEPDYFKDVTGRQLAEAHTVYNEKHLDEHPELYDENSMFGQLAKAIRENPVKRTQGKGQLLEVEVPDDATWLELDKPYSEQPKIVKDYFNPTNSSRVDTILADIRGKELYRMAAQEVGGQEGASRRMAEHGITGNKYMTGQSRAGDPKDADFNYVVFDDNVPKIVNRYMRKSKVVGKGSEGPLQGSATRPEEGGRPTPISKFRSNRNLEDISKEITPEHEAETWEQWIDEAGNIKMTTKMAENLATGVTPPQLKAAERFLLESQNRVFDLSHKVASGRGTANDAYLLGQELERASRVAKSVQQVVTNSARILNSRKIEVASDRALSASMRRMLASIDTRTLDNPEAVEKLAKKLLKGNAKAKAMSKTMSILSNALNLPRSLMSSMDLSAPLRQGIFLVGNKRLWKNIPSMFRQLGSEKAFNAVLQDIRKRPTYEKMVDAGLALASRDSNLSTREEQFISQWAEKIPVAGKLVKASERAYVGFLNKVRADVFDDLVRKYDQAKVTPNYNSIAKYVNSATGRGDLGKFNQASPVLSGLFFSPRLIASRVNLLNPAFYAKLDPIVRKEALKSLVAFGGIATTVAGLAALAGANVETDPRSSDFAKIKVGNTRYDILGGFGQYLTLGARLATNQKKNAKGEVSTLGEGFGSDTRLDVLLNFGINKESPVASFVTDYLRGKNAIGEPFDAKKKALESFIPLFLQDAADIVKEEGAKGIPMAFPGLFGVGMQTYKVDLGYDAFGRNQNELVKEHKGESDPVVLEVQRLNSLTKNPPLTGAPASFTTEGETHKLTDEQRTEWQRIMGDLQHQFLTEDMKSEDWRSATDQEKIDIVKQAHRDAFDQTKEYFESTILGKTADGDQPDGDNSE